MPVDPFDVFLDVAGRRFNARSRGLRMNLAAGSPSIVDDVVYQFLLRELELG